MHAALPLVYCSRTCDEQHTAHVDRIFEKKEGSLSLVLGRSCRPARVASSAEGGDGGGGSRQQASLQFAVSFFFFPSHNVMHFFGFCFSPLHHLVTFFWSFVLHVFSSLSAAQSFGDGAVSMSLTLFIFKISGVNRGGLGGH